MNGLRIGFPERTVRTSNEVIAAAEFLEFYASLIRNYGEFLKKLEIISAQ